MADLKISQLPSVAEQDIASVDEIPLNDVSASQTSKVAVKALIERGFVLADAGSIPATLLAAIPNSSVTAASIDGKAITRNQIADNTIQAGQIDSNTITSNEIVSNSLTNVLAPGSVSSTELDALSVGTTELQLLAVGNDQVANTSLTYAKLNLSDGDIPGAKINTLDGSKIVDASIANAKISGVDGSKIVDGSISYAKLDSNDIARGLSIDSTAGTLGIDNDLTTSGSGNGFQWNRYGLITGTQSIASTELPVADASNLGAIKIGTGLAIASGVVSIDAAGIAASNLATNSVTTSAIEALAVTDAKINDVSGSKISAGSITIDKLDSSDVARGLSVDATAGNIGINNTVISSDRQKGGLIFNEYGLITDTVSTIPSGDLPTADANNLGAVKIGTGIAIANGVISIDSSTIEASNLAADAVETVNIKDLNVTDGKIAGVSGSKITAGTVTYDKLDSADVGRGLSIDNTAGNIGLSNSVIAGSKGAVTFNQFGLITGTRTIPGSDIEPATTSATGVIKIGSGLSVDSSGEASVSGVTAAMVDTNAVGRGLDISGGTIGIASSLSGSGSFAGVNFNSSGIITSVDSVIPNSDLPKAGTTSSGLGCVYVPAGSGLALNTSTGELSVDASGLPEASIGDLAVSTGKLADGAVTDLKVTAVSGSKLTAGSVTYDKLDANDIARGLSIDSTAGTLGIANSISSGAGTFAGISYDITGLITSVAALIPATDLPLATTTTVGAISVSDGLAITTAGALSVSGITNAMLGTDSVRTLQVEDLAITDAKITGVSGAKITAGTLSPNALSSANVTNGLTVSGGNLQIDNSVSGGASSFAGLSFNSQGLITNVSALIPSTDLPISSSTALGAIKIGSNFSIDSSTGVLSVGVDGIDTVNLNDDCVTSAELAPGAVDNTALGSGLSGAKISTNSLPADAIVATDLDRSISLSGGKLGISNVISAAVHNGIGFNSEGLVVSTSSLLASELPISTASNVGAVSIGSNSGLSVSNAGALTLSNSYTGTSSINGLTINAFGQITSTSQITGSDINVASTSNLGVIKVASGGPFSIDIAGELSLANSGVSAGTYTSVTVDNLGRVTAASQMTDAQLPDHSAAKITSGTLSANRLSNSSIDGEKLSDSSVTLFGGPGSTSNIVTFPANGDFKGQRFWDEYNGDEYIWTGSSWTAVTITSGELVWLGGYSASDNTVAFVTTAGSAAGLSAGGSLPQASNSSKRGYLVVDDTGTGSGYAPAVVLNSPDYIVSDGTNWEHLDVSSAIAATSANQVSVSDVAPDISSNVQTTLQNLQNNRLRKDGGDITGTVRFTSTGVLQFEGSSEDAFETTLGLVNPTVSDKTILLPDESGTLITTASTGSITSSMLGNDIVNSNIASNCALSFTKLEALNSGNILIGNSSNQVASVSMTGDVGINNAGLTTIQAGSIVDSMIDSSAAISGSKIQGGSTSNAGVLQLVDSTSSTSTSLAATPNSVKTAYDLANTANTTASAAAAKSGDTFTGNLVISDAKELRFGEVTATGSNYISFRAPDAITSDISLIWPSTSPAGGQILKANASNANQLEWSSDAIDVAAANLTGSTLASNVTASSLTSVGTLASLTVSGGINADVTGALNGNAATATTLATARAINGVSFNGSADITVTADASTLTSTSLNSSITSSSLTSVGTLANLIVTNTISGSINGNAATATSLASSVNIGGIAFDGSTDINLPGVNTGGNQNTSGNAASATQFTVTANNADETVYPVFVDGSSSYQDGEVDTGLTYNPSSGKLSADKFEGDGSLLTNLSVSGTTINNNNNNRIITGSSTQDTLEAEATLTYNGSSLDFNTSTDTKIHLRGTDDPEIKFYEGNTSKMFLAWRTGGYAYLHNYEHSTSIKVGSDFSWYDGSSDQTIVHQGNVGSGGALSSKNVYASEFHGNGANLTYLDLADATNTGQIPVARLGSSGSASSSTFLRGDNVWATPAATDSTKMPLTGGTFTGDVIFEGATTGRDITFDRSDDSLHFPQQVKIKIGDQTVGSGNQAAIYDDNSGWAVYKNAGNTGIRFNWSNVDLQVGNTDVVSVNASGASITGDITATGTVTADSVASSANGMRRITTATTAPSTTTGFADGDLYIQYTP